MPRPPQAKKSAAPHHRAGQVKVQGAARHTRCRPRMEPVVCCGGGAGERQEEEWCGLQCAWEGADWGRRRKNRAAAAAASTAP